MRWSVARWATSIWAKVSRVLPGMQSAFIDIGLDRAAFLHVADLMPNIAAKHAGGREAGSGEAAKTRQIRRTVAARSVQPIERQILRARPDGAGVERPIGTRARGCRPRSALQADCWCFCPRIRVGVSQKIPAQQRETLRNRLLALTADLGGGFILRTNAEDASDAELAEDIAYLRKTWLKIKDAAVRQPAASLLHQDLSLMQRVLRDLVCEQTQTIRIDSREQFAELQRFAQAFMPNTVAGLALHTGERPVFDLFNVDEEIIRALNRRVDMKSGGYLIIDQTEALTTVDVNTGGFVGARCFDDTVFKTNLEAARVIARQLRLRSLGGIIIVDFIDMTRRPTARRCWPSSGLTRPRPRQNDGGWLFQPGAGGDDPQAHPRVVGPPAERNLPGLRWPGRVKTARSLCYDILREILREARAFNPREFRWWPHPKVVELFLDEESHDESQHLQRTGLGDFI